MALNLDTYLLVLKFAGIFLSGVFGVLGLIVDFRDDEGRITFWGRRALIGIVVSVGVAALTHAFEYLKSEEEASARAERTERLLSQIYRAVHPIEDVSVTFCVVAPDSNAHLVAYQRRLSSTLNTLSKRYPDDREREGIAFLRDAKRRLSGAIVRSDSSHLPASTDLAAAFALGPITLGISFSKQVPDHAQFAQEEPIPYQTFKPDLQMSFLSDFPEKGNETMYGTVSEQETGNQLIYEIDSNRIGILGQSVETDPRYWTSNGTVRSIPDLQGSTIIIRLQDFVVHEAVRTQITEIRQQLTLRYLVLEMTDGRRFFISSKQMSRFSDSHGLPYYVFTFPDSEEEMSSSLKYDVMQTGCPNDFDET